MALQKKFSWISDEMDDLFHQDGIYLASSLALHVFLGSAPHDLFLSRQRVYRDESPCLVLIGGQLGDLVRIVAGR
jgi:hypothetical protein